MKYLTLIIISLFLIDSKSIQGQDPLFSQFYSNPVYLNPAMVGISNQYRAIVIHRQQGDPEFGFSTSSFSFDGTLGEGNSGWGVQVMSDNQSQLINSTAFSMSLAHRIQLSKTSQFGLGMRVGGYQKQLNIDNVIFEDQLDGRNGIVRSTNEIIPQNKIINVDIAFGLLYSSENFFAGVNINHLNKPNENSITNINSILDRRYTVHAGGFLYSKNYRREDYIISPNIVFEHQGTSNYLNLGMYFATEVWTVGSWYRWNDAVILSFGATFGKVKFGYSYDLSIKRHESMASNSHELALTYSFNLTRKFRLKNRYKGQCPKFLKYLF